MNLFGHQVCYVYAYTYYTGDIILTFASLHRHTVQIWQLAYLCERHLCYVTMIISCIKKTTL